MSKLIYFLNILVLCLTPTLAYIVQGGQDFTDQPKALYWTIMIGQFLFGIILIALLAQSIKRDFSLLSGLTLLVTGPALSLGLAYLVDSTWQLTFFNYYIVEGTCFILFLFISFFKNRKKGLAEQGKANVYLAAPILIILLTLGLVSTINFDFFKSIYTGWIGIAAFAATIVVSYFGFSKNLKAVNQRAEAELDGSGESQFSGLNGVPMLLGIIAWFGRNSFVDMDFFQDIFMLGH